MCSQRNFFQGRKEFTITWEELWEACQGAAIWANNSVHLRGVLLDNSTPLLLKETGNPSWEDFNVFVDSN